ncbi:ATP-dependent RNA helicase DOB1, putative [Rhizoctonia solani AG-3 Rhs1AP]|uniref:ATP-dependent RNA helicase DOB1, putative n=2 Tax=Rhizoctonia solani AG-3 TaxID=1086053 RepID=X8J5A7_9AGAM|nr:ATP-dependent RNA helicase DOB1, putative [Rhizoctonia solani AG-3 Rhs1AP]KEP46646.1 putative ATP-dependent RNA helicase DOB1 [Rhizoctonia solani 123E]
MGSIRSTRRRQIRSVDVQRFADQPGHLKRRMLNLDEVPPLDVLMAWHTYMLNPRPYYEDGVTGRAFPLDHLDRIIDVDTLVALYPSPGRQHRFESLTGQPWICPVNTTPIDATFVPCPRCENATLNEVFWVTKENTGFAENKFKARCHTCAGVIDRSVSQRFTQVHFLTGQLVKSITKGQQSGVKSCSRSVENSFARPSMPLVRGDSLADSLGYSIKRLETTLKEGLNLRDGGALTWTLDLLGQFIDHDDKVEENKLADAYDLTAKYWEQRWGVPFHICGCIHPPQDKPFNPSEKLSRMFRGKGKHPEFNNPRPNLVSTHDCEAGSTHPSEHNSIVIVEQNLFLTRRDGRAHKHEKWAKQLCFDVEKGKVPREGWEAMSVSRSAGHDQGFMRPMPDPNLAPIVPYGPEACATHHGVINGVNLASTPMDGKHSAGVCAVGMGLYGMPPMVGFHINPTDIDPEQFATALEGAAYLSLVM